MTQRQKRALFVTYEGIEGAGKSTQLKIVAQQFNTYNVLCTREPGGTPLAEKIGSLLITPTQEPINPKTETYLMQAARVQHIQEVIAPALTKVDLILCDRFTDSSTAYQGFGRDMGPDWLEQLNAFSTQEVTPDLTFFIDIDVSLSMQRMKARKNKNADRFENQALAFYEKIRQGYLQLCDQYPARMIRLDGMLPLQELVQMQTNMIKERMS